ncbi:MAG: phospholipase D-like domain-containing protein [Pseudomonadota bacterium]|nr:phospholipase D-like domain-containing protein [Pseudomonadota bacterium]
MYVGSFNFDQRSLHINTEIGIVFEDPAIASLSSAHFDKYIDKVAFRVELIDDALRWTGIEEGGKKVIFDKEPYTSFWKRLSVNLMRVLPIDSML